MSDPALSTCRECATPALEKGVDSTWGEGGGGEKGMGTAMRTGHRKESFVAGADMLEQSQNFSSQNVNKLIHDSV